MRAIMWVAQLFRDLLQWNKSCYVMIGFDGETLREAAERLYSVLSS